jgi:folate-dependent phosphoribosylglycinamide formyltransferase PurN
MINIHPALLPSFGGEGMYGRRVHEAVVESGVRVTGPTVHFVNEEYDEGAIIAQWPVPVRAGDTPNEVAARVLAVEHRLLPAVVRAFAEDAFHLTREGRCRWERPWFGGEQFRMAATPGEDPAAEWMSESNQG